jgi:hypothetical protein
MPHITHYQLCVYIKLLRRDEQTTTIKFQLPPLKHRQDGQAYIRFIVVCSVRLKRNCEVKLVYCMKYDYALQCISGAFVGTSSRV